MLCAVPRPTTFPEVLARAKAGDRDALQSVFDPHLAPLHAFVRLRAQGLPRRREGADDVVQSVCRQAIEKIELVRADDPDGFRRWLFATASNLISDKFDFHTAARRDARKDEPAVDSRVDEADVARCFADLRTPSRYAMTKEECARIEAALARLPEDYREVVLLAQIAKLPREEVAARLGRSDAAVRQLLARARARLATLLAESVRNDAT